MDIDGNLIIFGFQKAFIGYIYKIRLKNPIMEGYMNFFRKDKCFRAKVSIKALLLLFMVVLSAAMPLYAQDVLTRKIVDDSSLRISIKDTWLTEIPSRVITRRSAVHDLAGGGRVELRVEQGRDEFMIILARELTGAARNAAGSFPGWAQGSWILTRQKDSGEAIRIRVFLRSDPYTYVQFRPLGSDKCQMDVVLYDAYVIRSLPVPVAFERLYTVPVEEVLNLAGSRFPRKYFEPDPAFYADERFFASRLREGIKGLQFADDGAMDQFGNYVFINTGLAQDQGKGLNCSGFAKWVIDGIFIPLTGQRLAIEPLKAPFGQRGSSFTELWEELRDPFFGLDWIRNLASRANSLLLSPSHAAIEEIEVNYAPFSQVIVRGSETSIRSYPGFLEDAGFGMEGLQALLYTLAIDEPGRFYLAAVNTQIGPATTEDNPRGTPRLRQYFHVAVLIPYFNEYGFFRTAVFESAAETSLNAFISRYPGHYVNLVRVPVFKNWDSGIN